MNNLAPMKNCPGGMQGNLNWMPGYLFRPNRFLLPFLLLVISHFLVAACSFSSMTCSCNLNEKPLAPFLSP